MSFNRAVLGAAATIACAIVGSGVASAGGFGPDGEIYAYSQDCRAVAQRIIADTADTTHDTATCDVLAGSGGSEFQITVTQRPWLTGNDRQGAPDLNAGIQSVIQSMITGSVMP